MNTLTTSNEKPGVLTPTTETSASPEPHKAGAPHDLVRLSDGRLGRRGGMRVLVREPGPESGTAATGGGAVPVLEFIASTERLDRFDEVITASGWRLEEYRRNPVFLNAHQSGDILYTLGKALVTEVREGRLYQKVEFAVEANPFAKIAYELYRGGFLNAVSVGFVPLRWEEGGPGKPWRRRYLEQELLEVSAVNIPANPDALQLGLRAGVIAEGDVREAAALLRRLAGICRKEGLGARKLGNSAAEEALQRQQHALRRAARWLLLARDLHHLLRNR